MVAALLWSGVAASQIMPSKAFSQLGFARLPIVSAGNIRNFYFAPDGKTQQSAAIEDFCGKVGARYTRLGWEPNPCGQVPWVAKYKSFGGNPLLYAEFGDGPITSLYLGGVHPDEITPVHLIFKFANYLAENPQIYANTGIKIVIAPLVNPDAFFLDAPPRVNLNGVDLNRNFLTSDWYEKAIPAWRNRRNADTRYFPGYFPNSEIETMFQVQLIDQFNPGKIISVHAPLGFLDYDGPGDQKPHKLTRIEKKAKDLISRISRESSDYKIVDYSFYPGSLGNFAGNEREIPTITLELETADASKVMDYWNKFRSGLVLSAQLPYLAQQDINRPGIKTGSATNPPTANTAMTP